MTQPLEEVTDGPCMVWPIDPECCPGWPVDPAAWTARHRISVEIATDMLWRRAAGRYGLCAEKIRPCRRGCTPDRHGTGMLWGGGGGGWLLDPYQDAQGRWFNFGCGCGDDCSCGPMCVLELPGPVNTVLEVKIGGVVVSPTTYRLDRFPGKGQLVRTSAEACWPTCQDLTKPDTEVGTFSVLYLRGKTLPRAAVRAVSVLACEIFKQCSGASGCRLPERVKTVSREGVTYDMFDPGEWLTDGLTGLAEVDPWLNSVNPHGLRQPSAVFSLDLPAAPRSARYRWDPS